MRADAHFLDRLGLAEDVRAARVVRVVEVLAPCEGLDIARLRKA